jgi:hypothetical protein
LYKIFLREELKMKCSKRVNLAVVGVVLAVVFLASSTWAGEAEVVAAINNVGLSRASAESGNTITVEGNVPNATFTGISGGAYWLDLGDISGLTINWKAKVMGNLIIY